MKRVMSLLLATALVLSLAACRKEEAAPLVEAPIEVAEKEPEQEKAPQPAEQLFWATGTEPVQLSLQGSVQESTETYVRELTSPQYQGRAGGSEGNRLAADYIAAQFEQLGLQPLPTLDGWKQSYPTATTAVLPGEAALVAPDGSETALKLGEDWLFRASPEDVEGLFSLTTDAAEFRESGAIWDAKAEPKQSSGKLCLTAAEVCDKLSYTNPSGKPSRLLVTEQVYSQLKQEGWRLRLRLPDAIDEKGSADNVLGYLPGEDGSKAVLLGANFDGPGQCGPVLFPGAYDNASGVATLIQTAAWLAQAEELPCDVIFAAFNTEDNRDSGSKALSKHLEGQYQQLRMVNLKCNGWKSQPLTVYGKNAQASLRNSLAGGLGLQYADRDVGSDETAFYGENMGAVLLFQDACRNDPAASSVQNSSRDTAENLDFAQLDDIAQKLAAWVLERGAEPLSSFAVYW